MFPIAFLRFASTSALWIALSIVCVAMAIGIVRRFDLPIATRLLIAFGAIVLALACGVPEYLGRRDPTIAVVVDLSASTRGATYRDRATLQRRVRELLGDRPHTLVEMSETASETKFEPAAADAIVLFSDAQFELPTAAPLTYVVVDPALEGASDGAIIGLSINQGDVSIGVRNQSSRDQLRTLSAEGIRASPAMPIGETLGSGSFLFRAPRDPLSSTIAARIVGEDRWPENNELRMVAPPLAQPQRWWISDTRAAPDSTWRALRPSDLPHDPTSYLAPSAIVLDNQPASALTPLAQWRLAQYVRDLGGALLIVGGDRAFGAGAYFNSTLDSLSPLASAPPTPMRHWIVLADSSGSMAAGARWQSAVDSVRRAISLLPANDMITVGSFARDVRWWVANESVQLAQKQSLPPADVLPNGPTNLEPALQQILARTSNTNLPSEVLIISDADAKIDAVNALAERLRAANIHVNLLATGVELASGNAILQLANATGGHVLRESDPAQWASRVNEVVRAAMPELLRREPADITFDESLRLSRASVSLWNRTWIASTAEPIARIGDIVVGARWNLGAGRVVSLGFPAGQEVIAAIAQQIESPPRDPRFLVRRDEGALVRIVVDAIENGEFRNGLSMRVMLRDDSSDQRRSIPFAQTAPGRYEVSLTPPRTSHLTTIVVDDHVIDRFALAGRYAAEFAAIGNDRDRMHELARRTNGRVIEPSDTTPLEITGPEQRMPLTSEFAFAGAALIAIGLIHWRRTT